MNTISFDLSWLIYLAITLFVGFTLINQMLLGKKIKALDKNKKNGQTEERWKLGQDESPWSPIRPNVPKQLFFKVSDTEYVNINAIYNASVLKGKVSIKAYPDKDITLTGQLAEDFINTVL